MKTKPKAPLALLFMSGILGATLTFGGDFVIKDIHQNKQEPLKSIEKNPVVLIFITNDCPIANGYVPEINRIYEKYSVRKVKLTLVHVDPKLSDEAALQHAREYALKPPVVIDRKHELVRLSGAEVTPEAVAFDSEGKIVYRGRINDRYTGFGDRRNTVREHNLRAALDAILGGRKVKVKETQPWGCFIEPLK